MTRNDRKKSEVHEENVSRSLVLAALFLSFSAAGICQDAPKEATPKEATPKEAMHEISEVDGRYVQTVPLSRLIMAIPKGGLVMQPNPAGGSADSPRYFYFENKAQALLISGWFESDEGYPGIKQFWADETAEWKRRGLREPKDVTFAQLGNWNAILYDEDVPIARNSHIRAHWVQAGTWIDIHLSLTADLPQKEIRLKLQDVLKAISVTEKPSR